ncbi:hypothetical protein B0G82_7259 [Paraburkholderia sp. BL17N1]|nr:hypothetical protein B0G82_7259 [Paraburkholderia sp. BL17N1]
MCFFYRSVQVSRVRNFADTAPGPPRNPRLSPETPAIPPRFVAPGWSSTARCPVAALSLFFLLLCVPFARRLHERDTCCFFPPFTSARTRRKKWRGQPLHRPVAMTGTLYRPLRRSFMTSVFLLAPPHPRRTQWLSPAAPTKSFCRRSLLILASLNLGPGGNSLRCEVLIATAMPCTLKPLCHRDRRCGAPDLGVLRSSR